MNITLTHHFVSRAKAVEYYAPYGYDKQDVEAKIRNKEIAIGCPKNGVYKVNREGRYYSNS